MCLSRPVAAFDVSSIPEVVEHGVTGLLSPPTAEGLADNLLRLLCDAPLRDRLGAAGRLRLMERFDVRRTFAALEDCLRA